MDFAGLGHRSFAGGGRSGVASVGGARRQAKAAEDQVVQARRSAEAAEEQIGIMRRQEEADQGSRAVPAKASKVPTRLVVPEPHHW